MAKWTRTFKWPYPTKGGEEDGAVLVLKSEAETLLAAQALIINRLRNEDADCGCNCGNCPCCWAREDAKEKT